MTKAICVEELTKTFVNRVSKKGAFASLFFNKLKEFDVINNLTFSIDKGESVAFIGPNGAGKSTTIKMLTGILYPTSGSISVLGLTPWKERQKLGYEIGCVFGQRSQLWYHLPPKDTYELLAKIYELDSYQKRLDDLVDSFEIGPLMGKPVRSLSLGERMRCEIVASLLHNPSILFLDEPTIGLDINAKLKIRNLLNDLCKSSGTTLFLTSHDTADIEKVCERVIVLDKGKLIVDSSLGQLKRQYAQEKIVTLITEKENLELSLPGVTKIDSSDYNYRCRFHSDQVDVGYIIHEASKLTTIKDILIEDSSLEEIIREVYQNG